MFIKFPKSVIATFFALSVIGAFLALDRVRFAFDFEQFFPSGDKDLEFFLEFKERFEPDDNFLLVGIRQDAGVFERDFLKQVQEFSLEARRISFPTESYDSVDQRIFRKEMNAQGDSVVVMHPVLSAQSLLQVEYPLKNPFTGFTTIPAVHLDEPTRYSKDKERILKDERLVDNLISEDAKTLVVVLKTVDNIGLPVARELIAEIKTLLEKYDFEEHHLLGRAFFQTEIVKLQIREFYLATIVSFLLVSFVLFLLFRRLWGVIIAVISILVGLMMFVGMLGVFSSTLDTMALLYPIIMIIVATSDVIHVMSKYIDELHKGNDRLPAIKTTIREIGMSIFLTSTTTAIGFISLMSSRLVPIQQFGLNAAVGVMLAYISVIIFTTTVLALFRKEQIIKLGQKESAWASWMHWVHGITQQYEKRILLGFTVLLVICCVGISQVSTNTQFIKILPKNSEVTNDFMFFEREFSGFRPFELAVSLQGDYTTDDFEVIQEIDKIEQYYKSYAAVKSMSSITGVYKSINQAYNGNRQEAFVLPKNEATFRKYNKAAKRLGSDNFGILVSNDKKHTRISAKVLDIGADSIKAIRAASRTWMAENIDSTILKTRLTGTGIIIDKNSDYIRDSLLQGLLFAILVISLIVGLMYKNIRMIFIALIPNVLPLMIAAAILGFSGTPLEAGVAIVFAIIFGIAVDDTIHLLSKFKLMKDRGLPTEEAIKITLVETGKALCLTTVILFFGFLSLLMSSNPPAITVGTLISSTLISALVCDLLIIPIMLRRWMK